MGAILVLGDEQDWRVRAQTVQVAGQLARFIPQGVFDERLRALVFGYLNDSVNFVRR